MTPNFIQWPTGSRIQEVISGFKLFRNMDNIIAAIDGTHLHVVGMLFKDQKISYMNRKGYPSINMQGACDHLGIFTDCYVGWPGSIHDARVYQNSDLCRRITHQPDVSQ